MPWHVTAVFSPNSKAALLWSRSFCNAPFPLFMALVWFLGVGEVNSNSSLVTFFVSLLVAISLNDTTLISSKIGIAKSSSKNSSWLFFEFAFPVACREVEFSMPVAEWSWMVLFFVLVFRWDISWLKSGVDSRTLQRSTSQHWTFATPEPL